MKIRFVFILLFTCFLLSAKAQCPEIKKVEAQNNAITLSVSQISKNTFALLYKIDNGQPNLLIENKPEISNNSFIFAEIPTGNYVIRLNEKGCKPLFIGKEENIIVK